MKLSVFPNLQSIGNGGITRKEAKANAIIAFLAHMEKRKQVGLFVPYLVNIVVLEFFIRYGIVRTYHLSLSSNIKQLHRFG